MLFAWLVSMLIDKTLHDVLATIARTRGTIPGTKFSAYYTTKFSMYYRIIVNTLIILKIVLKIYM
jgi:hypothetical protein